METREPLAYLMAFLIVLISANCTKPEVKKPVTPSLTRLTMVDANADITIELPRNSIVLNGRIMNQNLTNQITRIKWQKISGPSSGMLENPETLQTRVSNLEKGTYQFELSAWDNVGHFDIDTMTLTLQDPTGVNTQIFFWNMKMIIDPGPFYSYASLEIDNINEFVPTANPFTIHIKRDGSSAWEPVILYPQNNPGFTGYSYNIIMKNGTHAMNIAETPDGFTLTDTPDIKIEY